MPGIIIKSKRRRLPEVQHYGAPHRWVLDDDSRIEVIDGKKIKVWRAVCKNLGCTATRFYPVYPYDLLKFNIKLEPCEACRGVQSQSGCSRHGPDGLH